MCSRESYAVLPSRFIASLLILLAAFLIGISAAQFATMHVVVKAEQSFPSECSSY